MQFLGGVCTKWFRETNHASFYIHRRPPAPSLEAILWDVDGLFLDNRKGDGHVRPGVLRLMEEAMAANVHQVICSTTSQELVAVREQMVPLLGSSCVARLPMFAGDMVRRKQPAASEDVYRLAVKTIGVDKTCCVVIVQDSQNTALEESVRAAGIRCFGADMIIDDLAKDFSQGLSLLKLQQLIRTPFKAKISARDALFVYDVE